uniref:C2 domain-containing protein n=1 Tax=Maylandia zebra TaxID=106582 RepID=A0A3P9DAE3_9CICH
FLYFITHGVISYILFNLKTLRPDEQNQFFNGYVKVNFNKLEVRRSPVIYNNNNPHWGMVVDLGSEDISSAKLRFEVWDEDNKWDDDLLGACEPLLTAGVKKDLCNLNHVSTLEYAFRLMTKLVSLKIWGY